MDVGLVGGIIGSIMGLAGGALGTYASIKNTGGPGSDSSWCEQQLPHGSGSPCSWFFSSVLPFSDL